MAVAIYAPALAPGLLSTLSVAATTATIAAATAVISAGLLIVGTLAINAVLPAPRTGSGANSTPTTFRQSVANSFIIYGKRRVGGLIVFFHPKKVGKQHYRYFVIATAGHRCQGVVSWMLNDQIVSVNSTTGAVTSGPYAGNAWLWFARGEASQTANATFVSECDGQWTTNHRGRGVAAIYAKFKMTNDVVQAGFPNITAVIQGRDEIRDPRTGTSGYTNNAISVFYDWLALPRADGGFGAAADEIPDDSVLSAWANVCDEDVSLAAGGTEKRYALDAVITTGAAPSEVRAGLVIAMAGTFSYVGGKFLCRPGYWNPVSVELSEDDLVGPIRLPALADAQDIATEVTGTFIDPSNDYQPQPIPARSVTSLDDTQMDVDLPHITSVTRGQRILEIMLRRAHCEKKLTWPMNIAGLEVQAMDTVRANISRYSLSNYAFVVDGWGLSADYSVNLTLREENEDIYDWATSMEGSSVATPTIATAEAIADAIAGIDPEDLVAQLDTVSARGAHILKSRSVAYPVSSDDNSITITTFSGVIDDGTTISFPADSITGLASGAAYGVFWNLTTTAYEVEASPASTRLASPNFVSLFAISTSTAGVFPTAPTVPGGFGGDGRMPRSSFY